MARGSTRAGSPVRNSVRLLDSPPSYGGDWASTGRVSYLRSMTDDRPRLWTPHELAEYTGIPIRTLADLRTERARRRGLGLPFIALSAHSVRYRDEDVEAFIAGRIIAPPDRSAD